MYLNCFEFLVKRTILNINYRRRKGVYGPALGRRCVLFVDDLIACDTVEGNIRTPLELLRHWLNYECVFEGKTASKMELVDIVSCNILIYLYLYYCNA